MSAVLLSEVQAEALVSLLRISYANPQVFIEQVLGVKTLRTWQVRACQQLADRIVLRDRRLKALIRTCHGAGKTWFAAALFLWYMVTRWNARGLTTAPTWAQVEDALWPEIGKLYRGSMLHKLRFGRCLTTKLDFGGIWFGVGASSDRPENLEGSHSPTAAIRVVDEAKAVEKGVIEATDGLLNSPESFDLWISTPSIQSGIFYDRDMGDDEKQGYVVRSVVDVDQLINDPRIPEVDQEGYRKWKAERAAEYGAESQEFGARVMARYMDNADGALFPASWVERAMAQIWTLTGKAVAGLDPAGSHSGDQSAVAVCVGPDEQDRVQVTSVTAWHERDTRISKGRALAIARDAQASLRIDALGLGMGIAEAAEANEVGVQVEHYRASDRARDFQRFTNRKAEDAWLLRDRLEKSLVRLPNDQKLKKQMTEMKYEINQAGKFKVVDPDDSPDLADAVIIGSASPRAGYAASNPEWL